jgi:hypothetical protein
MITKHANAKPYELPNAIQHAFRVVSSPFAMMPVSEFRNCIYNRLVIPIEHVIMLKGGLGT